MHFEALLLVLLCVMWTHKLGDHFPQQIILTEVLLLQMLPSSCSCVAP